MTSRVFQFARYWNYEYECVCQVYYVCVCDWEVWVTSSDGGGGAAAEVIHGSDEAMICCDGNELQAII